MFELETACIKVFVRMKKRERMRERERERERGMKIGRRGAGGSKKTKITFLATNFGVVCCSHQNYARRIFIFFVEVVKIASLNMAFECKFAIT